MHGRHHHGDAGQLSPDLPGRLQLVYLGHVYVHEHQIGPQTGALRHGLPAVGTVSPTLDAGFVGQHVLQALAGQVVVVDYE